MASPNVVVSTQELLDAQSHVWNLIFGYINSMSLKCAIQLGIADAIHKHGKPITLSQLAKSLSITKSKSHGLFRLMRILVHSKIFDKVKIPKNEDEEEEEEAYTLTRVSRLLLRGEPLGFAPNALAMIDPILMDPFHHMREWFQDDCPSPFLTRNGRNLWEFAGNDGSWNQVFNEGMASDARFVGSILVEKCKHVFEGLETLVDVAGGTGELARAAAHAFPALKCVVLELPHVIVGLEGSHEDVRFVSGDMFEFIPPADAVLLKWIMHDWSDEECVKILKKCKEAISGSKSKNGGKLIIIDMILDYKNQNHEAIETQLCYDMLMMTVCVGKERSEKEWIHLYSAAGFKNHKITPILGLRCLIEIFP